MSKITAFCVLLALASARDACGCPSGKGWCSAGGRNYCSKKCTTSSKEEALCASSAEDEWDACGCPSGKGWCSAGGRNYCSEKCTTSSKEEALCASSAEDEGTSCPKDTPESGSPCIPDFNEKCEYETVEGAPIWAECNPEHGWRIIGISTGPAIDGGWKRRRQSGTSVQERLMGFAEPQMEPTEAETRRLDVTAEDEELTVVFLHVGEKKDWLATAYEAWLTGLLGVEGITEEDVEGIKASLLLDSVIVEVNGEVSTMEPAKVEELSAQFDDITQEEFNEGFIGIFNIILAAFGEESQ